MTSRVRSAKPVDVSRFVVRYVALMRSPGLKSFKGPPVDCGCRSFLDCRFLDAPVTFRDPPVVALSRVFVEPPVRFFAFANVEPPVGFFVFLNLT